MKLHYLVVGIIVAMLLTSCAKGQPAIALPTATYTAVPPTATSTDTPVPTATSTMTPTFTPTATSTSTSTSTPTLPPIPTATATATTKPSPTPTLPPFLVTQDTPPLPPGKGGLIIVNNYQQTLDLDLGGTVYHIPASSRVVIFLSPGHFPFSASVSGYAGISSATDILAGYYRSQEWEQ